MSSVTVEQAGVPIAEDNALWTADINSWIKQAIREVYETYGDVVSVYEKRKSLLKFGQNVNVGTSEATIMEFAGSEVTETYSTSNDVDSFSCTDASFTGQVVIEGHYFVGNLLVFHVQIVTADGQNRVALSQSLARVTRVECYDETTFSTPSTDVCYVYKNGSLTGGVPDTTSDVRCLMTARERQSKKSATSISATDYAFVTSIYADVNKKTSASVDVRFKTRELNLDAGMSTKGRKIGGMKTKTIRSLNTAGKDGFDFDYEPFFIVPKNSDMEMTAEASNTAVSVSAGIGILLAKVVS